MKKLDLSGLEYAIMSCEDGYARCKTKANECFVAMENWEVYKEREENFKAANCWLDQAIAYDRKHSALFTVYECAMKANDLIEKLNNGFTKKQLG